MAITIVAEDISQNEIIKVGMYEYEPYFMIDSNGNMSGYYYDLIKLLQDKHHFKCEIYTLTRKECIQKLSNGELDLVLGITMNSIPGKKVIFNRHRINSEAFGVFSNQNIKFQDLHKYEKLRVGVVVGDINAKTILDIFKNDYMHMRIFYTQDYKSLEELLNGGKIDLMITNKNKSKDYFLIYDFTGKDVYIAGNKNKQGILDKFDQMIEEEKKPILLLEKKYFNDAKISYIKILMGIIISGLMIVIIPLTKKKIIINKIKGRMSKNQYTLYYQPIYNPRDNIIVGFEGLLRLINKKNKLISPSKIIPEIEKNDMLFEVLLWILEKAIKDYNRIKNAKFICAEDFYLSINISLKELENDYFVEKAISLLKESNLGSQRICLEIVERFKMDDMEKITQNIKQLKQAGFKLAIDDFGVEYSNLDIFQKLDVDIIKVDKMLTDGIGKDAIKEEIVLFISKLAHIAGRSIVLEGVEEASQDAKIKEMSNNRLYVQGYYYNKPMCIEEY